MSDRVELDWAPDGRAPMTPAYIASLQELPMGGEVTVAPGEEIRYGPFVFQNKGEHEITLRAPEGAP